MKKFKNRTGDKLFKQSISSIEEYYNIVWNASLSGSATLSTRKSGHPTPYKTIEMHLKFLHALYIEKYAELTGALIESVNNKEYLVFALCGRSIIELTANLRYYTKKMMPIIHESAKSGVVTSDQQKVIIDILDDHLRSTRLDWNKFILNDGRLAKEKKTQNKNHEDTLYHATKKISKGNLSKKVNILTAIKKWDKDKPNLIDVYEYFSELVHPNLGSNFLVMGAKSGKLIIGKSSQKNSAKYFCDLGLVMLACTAYKEGSFYMAILTFLKEMEDPPPQK